MKKFIISFITIFVSLWVNASIYGACYCTIDIIGDEVGFQVPEISFIVFMILAVLNQCIFSGRPKKNQEKYDICGEEFWKTWVSLILTKGLWLLVFLILYCIYYGTR